MQVSCRIYFKTGFTTETHPIDESSLYNHAASYSDFSGDLISLVQTDGLATIRLPIDFETAQNADYCMLNSSRTGKSFYNIANIMMSSENVTEFSLIIDSWLTCKARGINSLHAVCTKIPDNDGTILNTLEEGVTPSLPLENKKSANENIDMNAGDTYTLFPSSIALNLLATSTKKALAYEDEEGNDVIYVPQINTIILGTVINQNIPGASKSYHLPHKYYHYENAVGTPTMEGLEIAYSLGLVNVVDMSKRFQIPSAYCSLQEGMVGVVNGITGTKLQKTLTYTFNLGNIKHAKSLLLFAQMVIASSTSGDLKTAHVADFCTVSVGGTEGNRTLNISFPYNIFSDVSPEGRPYLSPVSTKSGGISVGVINAVGGSSWYKPNFAVNSPVGGQLAVNEIMRQQYAEGQKLAIGMEDITAGKTASMLGLSGGLFSSAFNFGAAAATDNPVGLASSAINIFNSGLSIPFILEEEERKKGNLARMYNVNKEANQMRAAEAKNIYTPVIYSASGQALASVSNGFRINIFNASELDIRALDEYIDKFGVSVPPTKVTSITTGYYLAKDITIDSNAPKYIRDMLAGLLKSGVRFI